MNAPKIIHLFHAFGKTTAKFSILVLCFTQLTCDYAYSSNDCDTSLTKNDSYESLSLILTCMNNKINALEEKIGQKSLTNTKKGHYKNDFIEASLDMINISKDNRAITLSLNLYNHTETDIKLMFYQGPDYPSLAGDDGTFLSRPTITGLPVGNSSHSRMESQYSSLKANTNTIIILHYKSTKDIEAKNFNFSAQMSQFIDGNADIFTIGIEHIHL